MAWAEPWLIGLVANALAATALMFAAWRNFHGSPDPRHGTAFFLLALGLSHWLHAFLLATPWMYSDSAGATARLLFSDWRIYATEMVVGAGAVVYIVLDMQAANRHRLEALRKELTLRQAHAMEVQDRIVQALAVAKLSLERHDEHMARVKVEGALEDSKQMISRWLGEAPLPTQKREAIREARRVDR